MHAHIQEGLKDCKPSTNSAGRPECRQAGIQEDINAEMQIIPQ